VRCGTPQDAQARLRLCQSLQRMLRWQRNFNGLLGDAGTPAPASLFFARPLASNDSLTDPPHAPARVMTS
jgi:hypothetical protein